MFGIDGRVARAAWTVFLVALLLFLIYWIRETLVIFTIALFFAYMISPLVDFLYQRTPARFSRTASLAAVYLLLVLFLATAGAWIGTRIAEQAGALVSRWPELVEKGEGLMERPVPAWLEPVRTKAIDMMRTQFTGSRILPLLQAGSQKILAGLSNLVYVVLIPLLAFYFVKDGRRFRRALLEYFAPSGQRRFFAGILSDVNDLLAQYMRALLVLSILTFVFYAAFFGIVGLPYALLLAGIASVLEFIPFIGPLIGMTVAILVGAFTGFPHLLWIVIFVLAYQIFQNYVIQPLVMSSGVEIHPLLVLFGVMAGEQIGGLAGVFFSIPVIATLRILLLRMAKARELEQQAEPPGDREIEAAPVGPERMPPRPA
jgi:predicted PurR-regulated permease PerM